MYLITDILGPTAFAPVKSDINGNIEVTISILKLQSELVAGIAKLYETIICRNLQRNTSRTQLSTRHFKILSKVKLILEVQRQRILPLMPSFG